MNERKEATCGSIHRMWRSVKRVVHQIFVVGLYEMTEEVFWIMLIYFFVSCAGSLPSFYGTDYFGEVVYGGSPDPSSYLYSQYQRGVHMGALGFALSGVVQILTSVALPCAVRWVSFKRFWIATQATSALVLLLLVLSVFQSLAASMAFVAILGVGTSAAGIIPFAMVGMLDYTHEKAGLMIALLNSAQVIAQAVAIFSSGLIVSATNNVSSGMAVGGGFGLVSLFITVVYLKEPCPKPLDLDLDIREDQDQEDLKPISH